MKINPLIAQAEFLRAQILATEQQVDTRVISSLTRDTLFHSLESSQHAMRVIQKKSISTDEFSKVQIQDKLEGLDQRIVILYGHIQALAVSRELSDITEEAKRLEISLHSGGNPKLIEEEITHLKEHIQTFTQDHALGRHERHAMAKARATMDQAYCFLQGQSLKTNLNITEETHLSDDEIELETVIELFEIAECLFRRKDKEGLLRFNQLSEKAHHRFRLHLTFLGETTGNPLASPVKSAQALIATAYDLADSHDGEPYLSEAELNKLFDTARSFG